MAQEIAATNPGQLVRDRLPILTRWRMVSERRSICGGFGFTRALQFGVFSIFLGVPYWQVGLALTLIRFYDAFSDPFVGWISDNVRTKYGSRRPFILFAGILCGLGLPILFLVSPTWSDKTFLGVSAVFWYMIFSSMIYIPIFSLFTVPFNSLANELTPDYEERTSIMTYRARCRRSSRWPIFMR